MIYRLIDWLIDLSIDSEAEDFERTSYLLLLLSANSVPQERRLVVEFDALSIVHGEHGDSLSLEVWPSASAGDASHETPETRDGARGTRLLALSTAVHVEILSAIPGSVDVGGLVVVQARLSAAAHRPLQGWPARVSMASVVREPSPKRP